MPDRHVPLRLRHLAALCLRGGAPVLVGQRIGLPPRISPLRGVLLALYRKARPEVANTSRGGQAFGRPAAAPIEDEFGPRG